MEESRKCGRRQMLKLGGAAIALIPVAGFVGKAGAATNAGLRTAMKYQDKPNGEKSCANCLQFIPGKSASDLGGCKILAGDTEVSPTAYCVAWAQKK